MTVNWNDSPNHIRLSGDTHVGFNFGALRSVTSVALPGEGHHPHVRISFRGCLAIDLCPVDATGLARDLPAAIFALGLPRECSGALAELEEA